MLTSIYLIFFFFFQAEDGIRDVAVTGVQTCALPISSKLLRTASSASANPSCVSLPARNLLRSLAPSKKLFRIFPPTSPSPSSAPVKPDRKSTRLNSSHGYISYAVFCLKKKNKTNIRVSQISRRKFIHHVLLSATLLIISDPRILPRAQLHGRYRLTRWRTIRLNRVPVP